MGDAIILFAHGSRDPQWAVPVQTLCRHLQAAHPERNVLAAYLEFMQPTLEEAVEQAVHGGVTRVAVAPLFLGQGGHLKRDLAAKLEALRARYPALHIEALPSLGESEQVLQAIAGVIAKSV